MIIAGTGHRPDNCPCLYDESHPWLIKLKQNLVEVIDRTQPSGIISGMALGWDTWLAEAALELNIPLFAYVPFNGQHLRWANLSRIKYQRILSRATNVKYIHKDYCKSAFFDRDEAMVDDCDLVYALWNPKINSGGTHHTVKYAEKLGKQIINFWNE